MSRTYTREELDELSRKDLQNEAKRAGIKANLKSAAIVDKLLEFYESGIPFGTPLVTPIKSRLPNSPSIRSPAKKNLASPLRAAQGRTPRTSTLRKGRRTTKPPLKPVKIRDFDEVEQALVSSCKEFLFENETLRPVSGTALHCLLQQIKVDQVTGGEDDPLWLADLGSIRLVATLLASLLNDIVVQSMITEKAIEREGFTMRYETYEQVLEELIPGELGQIAIKECKAVKEEVSHKDGDELGLTLDYNQALTYLNKLGLVLEPEDAMILTAVLEYLILEIWEVCTGKTLPGNLMLIRKEDVFNSINKDDELHQLFKTTLGDVERQIEEKTQTKNDNILKLVSSIKDGSICGADETDLAKIESELYFELYPALKSILRYSNGVPSFSIDSCTKILESISYYTELAIIYAQTNWIPLRSIVDGEVWDCLDVNTSIVVRFSVIPPEDDEGNITEISIVAKSLEEYIEVNKNRKEDEDCVPTLNVLLHEVDPIGSEMVQIYLGQDEEEDTQAD